MENRREVTLTGFSNNALDDVLRSNNNESNALNGNPGSAHAITKDAKIVNLEGKRFLLLYLNYLQKTQKESSSKIYRVCQKCGNPPLNISQTVHFRKKCFRQKLFGFEGAIRRYHWFDLEESFEGHVKITSIFLNGIPYIFLQILVAYLDSFPKHYN